MKDRNGDILIPPVEKPILSAEVESLVEKNGQLEKDILSLTKCYEEVVDNGTKADKENKTRLITMRSKPNYVEFVLL